MCHCPMEVREQINYLAQYQFFLNGNAKVISAFVMLFQKLIMLTFMCILGTLELKFAFECVVDFLSFSSTH